MLGEMRTSVRGNFVARANWPAVLKSPSTKSQIRGRIFPTRYFKNMASHMNFIHENEQDS